VFFEVFAQLAEQLGILGELFHQNLAGAVEDGLGVGESSRCGFCVEVVGGFGFRHQRRVIQQCFGQRCKTGLAGDLGLGAALLLVGQVEVFEALLGLGVQDLGLQLGGQFSLFLDRGQDGAAPVFHFAQIGQALFQRAQLGVVEVVGHFLAVAGDEGHGSAFVEQLDSGNYLGWADAQFSGNTVFDGGEHG
jgi:hypothetical protein